MTVRNLLSNDSGRFWSPESDYQELLQAPDRTSYAVGLEQAGRPGTVWAYNNAAIQTLDRVIRNATGTATEVFAQDRLFGPLGMTQHPDDRRTRAGGRRRSFFGMQSTCPRPGAVRPAVRAGRRVGGRAAAARRPGWRTRSAAPRSSSTRRTGCSGGSTATGPQREPLDDDNPGLPPGVSGVGQLVPGAPEDMYAALGFGGQVVLVDPGSGTVVVRLGTLGTG